MKRGAGRVEGRDLCWEVDKGDHSQSDRGLSIEVYEAGPDSEILVSNDLSETAAGLFGGTMCCIALAAGLGLWALGASAFAVSIGTLLSLGPAYLASRWALKLLVRKAQDRAELLGERAAEILSRGGSQD